MKYDYKSRSKIIKADPRFPGGLETHLTSAKRPQKAVKKTI